MSGLGSDSDKHLVLKPQPSELVGVGVIALALAAVGVVALIWAEFKLVYLVWFVFAGYIWFYLASIRLKIEDGIVSFHRFWRTEWKVPLEHATLGEGRGGDIPVFPAFAVIDRRTGKQAGVFIKSLFRPSDLEAVQAIIPAAPPRTRGRRKKASDAPAP